MDTTGSLGGDEGNVARQGPQAEVAACYVVWFLACPDVQPCQEGPTLASLEALLPHPNPLALENSRVRKAESTLSWPQNVANVEAAAGYQNSFGGSS